VLDILCLATLRNIWVDTLRVGVRENINALCIEEMMPPSSGQRLWMGVTEDVAGVLVREHRVTRPVAGLRRRRTEKPPKTPVLGGLSGTPNLGPKTPEIPRNGKTDFPSRGVLGRPHKLLTE